MKKFPELRGVGSYMALGVQMVVVTAVITAMGWWLDEKTGRAPLFLVVFFIVGALGGLGVVWQTVMQEGGGSRPRK